MPTHGNQYQSGFPDLYCFHPGYKIDRWVEVKMRNSFTSAQHHWFPKIDKIWVMKNATEDEYAKLFRSPNWFVYRGKVNPRPYTSPIPQAPNTPEGILQLAIISDLKDAGWEVMVTHGNYVQKGFPDLYVVKKHNRKWIEVKHTLSFTPNQKKYFPLMKASGIKIYIMTDRGQLDLLNGDDNYDKFKSFI